MVRPWRKYWLIAVSSFFSSLLRCLTTLASTFMPASLGSWSTDFAKASPTGASLQRRVAKRYLLSARRQARFRPGVTAPAIECEQRAIGRLGFVPYQRRMVDRLTGGNGAPTFLAAPPQATI